MSTPQPPSPDIYIGDFVAGTFATGEPLRVPLPRLLVERLLIQASSGGGKSWLIRHFVEEVYGKAPVILIDREGEFASIREHYDFVLAGRKGDTPVAVKTAAALARTVLELGANIICDLSDLDPEDQILWVAAFLNSLLTAPEDLWKNFVVIVDEAHIFAPEGEKPASLKPMAALASLGRKRGFCAVMATQRLAKLSKSVAAELQNVLIGKTVLDLDRKRAASALDIERSALLEFSKTIKRLKAGHFFAYGTSLSEEHPRIVHVGPCKTTHREPGARVPSVPPPPTAAIAHLLPRFAGLKKAMEAEEGGAALATAEVGELRAENTKLKAVVATAEKEVTSHRRRLGMLAALIDSARKAFFEPLPAVEHEEYHRMVDKSLEAVFDGKERPVLEVCDPVETNGHGRRQPPPPRRRADDPGIPASLKPFLLAQREILMALASRDRLFLGNEGRRLSLRSPMRGASRNYIALVTGYLPSGGGFSNAFSDLRRQGYIYAEGEVHMLTAKGMQLFDGVDVPEERSAEEILVIWERKKQLVGKSKVIVRKLYELKGELKSKAEIAELAGMKSFSSGGFNNYIGALCSRNIIDQPQRGKFRISPILTALSMVVCLIGLGGWWATAGAHRADAPARPAAAEVRSAKAGPHRAAAHARPARERRRLPVLAMDGEL